MTLIETLQAIEEIAPKLAKLLAEIEKLTPAQRLAAREALGLVRRRSNGKQKEEDSKA